MSIVLFILTIIFCMAGVAFSFVYIWLNTFSSVTDLSSRNADILKMSVTSMVLSPIFALLACLLANSGGVDKAIARTSVLYFIIAISWLAVILGCGISMLVTYSSKHRFKEGLLKSIKKIFSIAIIGFIIGAILAWLFS